MYFRIKILSPILFILMISGSCAQSWQSVAFRIPVEKYRGLTFMLRASVKAEVVDDSASARLWARVDNQNGHGFFANMWKTPIRSSKWSTYTIEGPIGDSAVNLNFGTLSEFSGSFYYDDFKLTIKNKQGVWETIYQTGFENGLEGWKEGIFSRNPEVGKNKQFATTIYNTKSPDHKNCLEITGANVMNYGKNSKAGHYVKVNGINLYYEAYGQGTPLLILHGNGGSINDAELQIDFFKSKYKVIAVDSRGQGNSIDNSTELTYDLMASDVNELLEQLHIDSAYIWGHSDGAILALILAMDHPKKVKKAIAYAANLSADTLGLVPKEFEDIKQKATTSKDAKEKQLNMLMYKYPHIPFSDLNKIKAEILVMSGDDDMIPLPHTLEIYNHIKKSNLCILPAATHGGAWEKQELFQEIAVEFFEKPFKK